MNDERYGRHGLIIFDGWCGACSTFIGRKAHFFEHHGFRVAPFQEEWARTAVGLDAETLSRAIHLRTCGGETLRGIDCFRYVARKIWWLSPVSFILGIEFLRPLLVRLYDFVARRRQGISKACGLDRNSFFR